MEERGGGTSRGETRWAYGQTSAWGNTKSYDIRLDPAGGEVLISTTDYHPGELVLTAADLRALLAELQPDA